MKLSRGFMLVLVALCVLSPSITAYALPVSGTDLWDVSNGATVMDTSGPLNYRPSYRSYVENMFGAVGGVEPLHAIFKDYMSPGYGGGSVPSGYIHHVEWATDTPITLRSFNLVAANEGMDRRAFNRFTLYYGDGGGAWELIYDLDGIASYDDYNGPNYSGFNQMELAMNLVSPVNAQYFRAEFTQAPWTDSRAVGPRVWELDGYDTFLDGSTGAPIPEPTTVLLLGAGLVGLAGLGRKKIFKRG